MTGFNHGMTGAVIALTIKQPYLAIPLSFASHYAADMVPHYSFELKDVLGRRFNQFTTADFIFSVLLMGLLALLFPSHKFLIWACMIAAAIPDLAWWFYRNSVKDWPHSMGRFTRWHFKIAAHIRHFYFDIVWFIFMWAIVLVIKL